MSVVGFQGESGAFSEAAILALLEVVTTRGYRTFDELVDAVSDGEIECGLLPCENTIHGSIARSYDLIAAHPNVHVVDETAHPIVQALVGTNVSEFDEITTVCSHPVALEQCRAFFSRRPDLQIKTVEDTAGAIRMVVESGDKHVAAIGPALAAQRYGGRVLLGSVGDAIENITRFFLIATNGEPGRNLGRALVGFELPHQAGSLHEALGKLADKSLNLRNL
nr:hypothetical protein [Candidatus Eremiobacteraeota bacterium]